MDSIGCDSTIRVSPQPSAKLRADMSPTTESPSSQAASLRRSRAARRSVAQLLSPWEEFRQVIPLVSLKSLLHRPNPAVPKVAVLMCTM